jgi:hypothetical protein
MTIAQGVKRLLNLDAIIVTVTDSGTPDAYGDPTTETTTTEAKCWITRRGNQAASAEEVGGADWQIDTLAIYFPAGTAVAGRDQVTVRDVTYDVLGPPHTHIDPRSGNEQYMSAAIRRVS